jgi:hypothetical protein
MLSHGANVIILLHIIIKTVRMEWSEFVTGALFFMEIIILNEGIYSVLLHEPVVFLGAIAGVCHACLW